MAASLPQPQRASCECGRCTFGVAAVPVARFICHCTICQAFNSKPFADVTVLKARGVTSENSQNIAFRKYRSPPNIERGTCRTCGKPAIEHGGFGPMKFAFIPSANYEALDQLPAPQMHIFYHRRVSDAVDDLPKYNGYWSSELAVVRALMQL